MAADPFSPFLAHEDVRQRRVLMPSRRSLDDVFDSPDRTELETRFDQPRLRLVVLVGVLITAGFIVRLFQLQIVNGATWRDVAERNRLRQDVLTAPRGIIEDRNGEALAQNRATFAVRVYPKSWKDAPADEVTIRELLRTTLKLTDEQLQTSFESIDPTGSVTVADDVPFAAAATLTAASARLSGLDVVPVAARTYPLGPAGAHVIGYVGKPSDKEVNEGYDPTDTVGRTMLESSYEEVLRGKNGQHNVERDSLNQARRTVATVAPVAGNNLRLTLDAGLQKTLFDSLNAKVRSTRATGGAAVAIDPRSGAIRALVSSPSFDTNAFSRGLSTKEFQQLLNDPKLPLFSRATTGEFPSGSTIKPFFAAAALDANIITATTSIMSSGGIRVGPWFFPDWQSGGHGGTTVTKAIAESVNTFFYTIGGGHEQFTGLGVERMSAALRQFGFGEATTIDLPTERPGFLPSKAWKEETKHEPWYIGDTYHFAIGQGDILVTPLQLANGITAIANGGTVYKPYLVETVTNPEGTVLAQTTPGVLQRAAAKPTSLAVVRQGMRQAVTDGSARALGTLPVAAAGKTGTAQFGTGEKTHSWFTGFAPYESPELVIAVFVEGGGEGHAAALPVAKDALNWYFTHTSNNR